MSLDFVIISWPMSISQGQLSQTQLEDIEVCSCVSMLKGRSRTDVRGGSPSSRADDVQGTYIYGATFTYARIRDNAYNNSAIWQVRSASAER